MAIRKSSNSGIPFGNNAGRPAANVGQPYFNGEAQRLELYTSSGWQNIVSETPGVVSINGQYLESNATNTLEITGTNFTTGAVVSATGINGVEVQALSSTVNSIVSVSATFSGLSAAYEPYDIKVTNTSNLFGILPDSLYINQSPIWQTASGSLGSFNEEVSITLSALSATDPESTAISYVLASGSSLPSGLSLNSSTGVISGTLPDISANTTYTFTINASDGSNAIPRTFSLFSKVIVPIEYLVVAGGGGGGGGNVGDGSSGGGGAGGLLTGSSTLVSLSTYLLTVGTGAAGGLGSSNGGSSYSLRNAANGSNSVFSSFTAIGGGGGRCQDGTAGGNGGSGGGGAGGGSPLPGAGGSPTNGQGNSGGAGGNSPYGGGGGGGAGGSGGNGGATSGAGGLGLANSITGSSIFYAGGGGAGANKYSVTSGASGGSSIGGAGGSAISNGGSGAANTGSGGGAGGANSGAGDGTAGGNGGAGGNGVVIIAYPNTFPALTTIPGTLTYDQPTRSGYRVYRFTAGTGTITV